MPKISIETCDMTPNYCAIEAVGRFIRDNYTMRHSRDYQSEQTIKVESGRTLKVVEIPRDDGSESVCDCQFVVEKVEVKPVVSAF